MSGQSIEYGVTVVRDKIPGTPFRFMYIEPPIDKAEFAAEIVEQTKSELITLKQVDSRAYVPTRSVFRLPLGRLLISGEQLIEQINDIAQAQNHSAAALAGLPAEVTEAEYNRHVSQRAWEAAA